MTNKELAKSIVDYFDWWELDENNCYNEILKSLNENNTKDIETMLVFFDAIVKNEQLTIIMKELQKRLKEMKK